VCCVGVVAIGAPAVGSSVVCVVAGPPPSSAIPGAVVVSSVRNLFASVILPFASVLSLSLERSFLAGGFHPSSPLRVWRFRHRLAVASLVKPKAAVEADKKSHSEAVVGSFASLSRSPRGLKWSP
jgi:hypothetical protein